jgi:hypothetical protein
MKRCLLAAALVTVCAYSVASADYLIIKIDLNQPLPGEQKAGAAGQGGYYPSGPGGVGGAGSGYGKGGGAMGGGSLQPPGGQQQPGGGDGPGGLQPGGIGGGGKKGGGMPGGGFPGTGGMPGGGYPGAGSGYPGGYGDTGGKDPAPSADAIPDKAPLYVYACLELRKPPTLRDPRLKNVFGFEIGGVIDHRLGKEIYVPASCGTLVVGAPVSVRFAKKFNDVKDNKNLDLDTRRQKLLELAEWALQRGMVSNFHAVIDELKKYDAKHPVVVAVEKTRKELAKAPKVDDASALSLMDDLKKESYRPVVSEGGHYTFLTNVEASGPRDDELKKRMAKMEEVYSTFFFWFALKGEARTPPASRLVVVVVDTPYNNSKDFDTKQALFNYVPMVAGGFTAQRDNVVITASRRTDEAFSTLQYLNRMKWDTAKVTQKELLTDPKIWDRRMSEIGKEIPMMQTLALVQKAMEEEGEMTTLSHEGIRQLVAATGMLPRTVATAEWARFGLASFFEVPHYAFYPSTGGPSWEYLANFQALRANKKLEQKDAKEILLKVVTDDYFHQAYDALRKSQQAKDKDKDQRQLLQMKADFQLEVARATSWSLMYYLVQKKSSALDRYFREIADLPRDMDYDAKVLKDCFYRAFGLLVQDPNNPGRQIVNISSLESLAAAWFSSMETTFQDIPELGNVLKTKVMEDLVLRDKIIAKLQDPTPITAQPGAGGYPGMGPGKSGFGSGAGSGYPPGSGAGSGYPAGSGAGSGYPPGQGPNGGGANRPGGSGAGSGYPPGQGPNGGGANRPGGSGAGSGYPPGQGPKQ